MPQAVPLLSVDLGNTTCGLRLQGGPEATDLGRLDPRAANFAADLASLLAELLAGRLAGPLSPSAAAALSSVAAPEVESAVRAALRETFGERFLADLDAGVEIACRDAHTIGADRLFAARGAAELLGASTLVLDAGTALTVDAVEVLAPVPGSTAERPARFLGGAIAPGPRLLAEALASAARLHAIEPRPGVPALGLDTPAALAAGVTVGFRGAALELVLRIGEESGLGHGSLAVCGGARDFLLEPPLFAESTRVHVLPHLVHAGLRAAAEAHLASGGPQ